MVICMSYADVVSAKNGVEESILSNTSTLNIPDTDSEIEEIAVIDSVEMTEAIITSTRIKVSEDEELSDTLYAKPANDVKHSGNYSIHIYTQGKLVEIIQEYSEALTAGVYTLTWYAKGEGTLWFYSNWGLATNPEEFAASHAVDHAELQEDGWVKYTKAINIDGIGDTAFLFHTDGIVDVWIDDVSLVDAEGVDYIVDGGFESVKLTACTGEHIWDAGVITKEPTTEAEGVKKYTCAVCIATKVEIIEKLPVYRTGDTNGDNEISVKDVVPIRRYIAGGYTVIMNEEAADVNGDGEISVKDVVPIRRYIAGGYGVEL